MDFPFGLYSQFSGGSSSSSGTGSYYSNASIDAKVSRICRNIASSVIRSAKNREDEDDTALSTHFSFPQIRIPKEVIIFSAIVITKIAMYITYKSAQKHGIECMDL